MVRFGDSASLIIAASASGFNSSMVRFGATAVTATIFHKNVSIPVWCDLEHFQEIAFLKAFYVSIPVWCDLESPGIV